MSLTESVAFVLENNVKVLAYSGDQDFAWQLRRSMSGNEPIDRRHHRARVARRHVDLAGPDAP